MKDSEQTRRDVSADYAKALQSQGSGCCGGPVPKRVVARIAGYSDADFAALVFGRILHQRNAVVKGGSGTRESFQQAKRRGMGIGSGSFIGR